jgi:hypothetical protein
MGSDQARGLAAAGPAENNCGADNHYVWIGGETYFISADGYLMPTKKNQTMPGLKGFDPSPR